MRTISPLPVAPRPFDDELLSSWQARVACHYGRTAAELELWLHPSSGSDIGGFERRDFDPDEAVIRLWAEACRIDGRHIAGMALRRFTRPLDWYFLDHHRQAFCPVCLREDERAGRDHHIRCSWSCVEALACPWHQMALVDICGRCFGAAGFRFECVEERARLICSACSTTVTHVRFNSIGPEKVEFLLLLSATVTAAVEGFAPVGGPGRDEIARATRLLWAPSQADGKPFILWLDPALPSRWRGGPWDRAAPLATATLAWRTLTLIGAARLLDLAEARRRFGPPPAFLLKIFEAPQAEASSRRPALCGHPADARPSITLRSDADYRALAQEILESAEWRSVQGRSPATRNRVLGRLMNQALEPMSRGRAGGPGRARP